MCVEQKKTQTLFLLDSHEEEGIVEGFSPRGRKQVERKTILESEKVKK